MGQPALFTLICCCFVVLIVTLSVGSICVAVFCCRLFSFFFFTHHERKQLDIHETLSNFYPFHCRPSLGCLSALFVV